MMEASFQFGRLLCERGYPFSAANARKRAWLSLSDRHMNELPKKWSDYLFKQPESGMTYQIVTITLRDGRKFEVSVTDSHIIGRVRGYSGIPFDPEDIASIEVTPDWLLRSDAQTWWTSKS